MSIKLMLIFLSIFDNCTCNISLKEKCFTSLSDGTDCNSSPDVEFPLMLPNNFFGTVCCHEDGLGCFSNLPGTPFECFASLPDCMNKIRPQFYVYTSDSDMNNVQEFDFFNMEEIIRRLKVNVRQEFFFLIHGFGDEWPKPWIPDMKDALISLGYNVMVVRWTGGSQNYTSMFNYFKAAADSRTVGAAVAKVMRRMVNYGKLDLARTTIVGYSLGAHLAGHVGRHLPGIKRIIGLDPAGPLFTCQNTVVRLDPTDARMVQVIHTNGDSFYFGGLGTMQNIGHIDFYANGGRLQPSCKRGSYFTLRERIFAQISDPHDQFWCSHSRAPVIFTEMIRNSASIKTCNFTSFPCRNDRSWDNGECFHCPHGCPIPGLDTSMVPVVHRGKYFFNTKHENATNGNFCGPQFLITLKSETDVEGKIIVHFSPKQYLNQFEFQGSNEKLFSHKEKSRVAVINWSPQNDANVSVTYFSSLPYQHIDWHLLEFSITDETHKTFRSASHVLIKHSVETDIRLLTE